MFSAMTAGWKAAIVLVILLLIAGAYFFGRYDGRELEASEWRKKAIAEQSVMAAKMQAVQNEYRALERKSAEQLAGVAQHYEQERANESKKREKVLAGVRSGATRLRIPVTHCEPGRGSVPLPSARPGDGDGGATAELSAEIARPTAESLVALASEADAVVLQLGACQAIVRADRAG